MPENTPEMATAINIVLFVLGILGAIFILGVIPYALFVSRLVRKGVFRKLHKSVRPVVTVPWGGKLAELRDLLVDFYRQNQQDFSDASFEISSLLRPALLIRTYDPKLRPTGRFLAVVIRADKKRVNLELCATHPLFRFGKRRNLTAATQLEKLATGLFPDGTPVRSSDYRL